MEKISNEKNTFKDRLRLAGNIFGSVAVSAVILLGVKSCNEGPSYQQRFDACVDAGENGHTSVNVAGMNIDCGDTFLPED